ncbi:ParA family protein [Clostridiaceae bacterium]|jgi:chromosome partitioning protein|nr:ParA family protein [Clostridiaceae bacterium]
MCRIITVANQKGGVTKTTICQHLSYLLAEQGRRVLCVDFDPQINLTSTLLPDGQAVGMDISGVMACLLEDQDLPVPSSYIQRCGKADLIPGSKNLGKLETSLLTEMGTERFLQEILSPLRAHYDYILIDTNRAASPLMTNALTAADSVLVPICPEFYSTEGLSDLIASVLKNRRRLNPHIQFEGVVFSRCNLRTNLYRTTRANVETAFRGEIRVFKTAIPDTVKVGDAISRGLTVMEYAPESKASSAYQAFAKEVLASETERAPAEGCTIHVLSDSGVRRVG